MIGIHLGIIVLHRDLVVFCECPLRSALSFQFFLVVSPDTEITLIDVKMVTIQFLQSSAEAHRRRILRLRANLTRAKTLLRKLVLQDALHDHCVDF